jgi:hypothetical protein
MGLDDTACTRDTVVERGRNAVLRERPGVLLRLLPGRSPFRQHPVSTSPPNQLSLAARRPGGDDGVTSGDLSLPCHQLCAVSHSRRQLRPESSAARVGEHSAVVWKLL